MCVRAPKLFAYSLSSAERREAVFVRASMALVRPTSDEASRLFWRWGFAVRVLGGCHLTAQLGEAFAQRQEVGRGGLTHSGEVTLGLAHFVHELRSRGLEGLAAVLNRRGERRRGESREQRGGEQCALHVHRHHSTFAGTWTNCAGFWPS